MAPKGTKEKAAAAAAPAAPEPAAAAAANSLRASEADRGYLLELENALATINGHPLFHNMVGEEPRSPAETGFTKARVFDNDIYQQEVASGIYTAGGSLFWLDLCWPSTGVMQVAKYPPDTALAEPKPYPGALHVAVAQGYSPLSLSLIHISEPTRPY